MKRFRPGALLVGLACLLVLLLGCSRRPTDPKPERDSAEVCNPGKDQGGISPCGREP